MIKPNLFLVGLPKAGTTSLFNYLQIHSEIFFPDVKEPHFFNTDTNNQGSIDEIEKYLALFKNAENQKYVGEASTHYLMSDIAAKNIKDFSPKAKIVIMLRKPSDIIYSAYYQNVYNGTEKENNFEKALMLENSRKHIKGKEVSNAESFHLLYSRFVKYERYIKNYFNVFGKENVLIIFFDDFKNNTEKEFNRVLKFLSIENEGSMSFKQYNSSKKIKSVILRSLLKNPPKFLVYLSKKVFTLKFRRKIIRFIKKKNTVFIKKKSISPKTEKMLTEKYTPEVVKLEALLNVDLSHWKS